MLGRRVTRNSITRFLRAEIILLDTYQPRPPRCPLRYVFRRSVVLWSRQEKCWVLPYDQLRLLRQRCRPQIKWSHQSWNHWYLPLCRKVNRFLYRPRPKEKRPMPCLPCCHKGGAWTSQPGLRSYQVCIQILVVFESKFDRPMTNRLNCIWSYRDSTTCTVIWLYNVFSPMAIIRSIWENQSHTLIQW